MKTCIYAVCLNEEKHIERFIETHKQSDYILICDTGSTDKSLEILNKFQNDKVIVHSIYVNPWRFDVARNIALSLVPKDVDICLSIDLDEYLQEGWYEALNKVFIKQPETNRFGYHYVWNWKMDGTPDLQFVADKIHSRNNYIWKHPCHEMLYCTTTEHRVIVDNLVLHHHADPTKSRGQYLNLLKIGVEEDPNNDRVRHYYARELFFKGKYDEAIEQFKIHLTLPAAQWLEERSASYRYIARCYRHKGDSKQGFDWAFKACLEWPHCREPFVELAHICYDLKDWETCFWAARKALSINNKILSYMVESENWGYVPYDLAGLAAWNLGFKQLAKTYAKIAFELDPTDKRLKSNYDIILADI